MGESPKYRQKWHVTYLHLFVITHQKDWLFQSRSQNHNTHATARSTDTSGVHVNLLMLGWPGQGAARREHTRATAPQSMVLSAHGSEKQGQNQTCTTKQCASKFIRCTCNQKREKKWPTFLFSIFFSHLICCSNKHKYSIANSSESVLTVF